MADRYTRARPDLERKGLRLMKGISKMAAQEAIVQDLRGPSVVIETLPLPPVIIKDK